MKARKAAGDVLGGMSRPPHEAGPYPAATPFEDIVRLLDDTKYRLIRSSSDLSRVLVEAIKDIERSSGDYLSMLYLPVRTPGAVRTPGRPPRRAHLPEEALQAYLFCRLKDRLPEQVLKVAFVTREPLAARNHRIDIKVDANTIDGGKAAVVIELKWSSNVELQTSLQNQLGDDYLISQSISHGIYLVGWTAPPVSTKRIVGKVPVQHSKPDLETLLEQQASDYRLRQPELRITPVVIDLTWRTDTSATRSPTALRFPDKLGRKVDLSARHAGIKSISHLGSLRPLSWRKMTRIPFRLARP